MASSSHDFLLEYKDTEREWTRLHHRKLLFWQRTGLVTRARALVTRYRERRARKWLERNAELYHTTVLLHERIADEERRELEFRNHVMEHEMNDIWGDRVSRGGSSDA